MPQPAIIPALRPGRTSAALCAIIVLAACAGAGGVEREAARSEVARVEAVLEGIESRALRDPELMRLNEALGAELMEAMLQADPGLAVAAGLLPLLQEQRGRAIQAGDAAAAAAVDRRIAAIEQRYLRAQGAALRDRSLSRRADRFHALLQRRMIEADADAERLLQRYAELSDLLAR